jgi:hypothetical protein
MDADVLVLVIILNKTRLADKRKIYLPGFKKLVDSCFVKS